MANPDTYRMKDSDKWYWQGADQKPVGPFDIDALRQLAAAGVISDQTLVAAAGSNDWVTYSQVDMWDPREDAPVEQSVESVIKLNCPGCGQGLSATPDQQGMEFKCPNCNGQVVVPAAAQPSRVQSTTLLDSVSGAEVVHRLQSTETNRNSGLPTEGVAGWLDHGWMDWFDNVVARMGMLPKILICGSIVGVIALFVFAAVRQKEKSLDKTTVNSTVGNESRTGKVERVKVKCTLCNGVQKVLCPSTCKECGGRGTRMTPSGYSYLCADCGGSGKVMIAETCLKCGGRGFTWDFR